MLFESAHSPCLYRINVHSYRASIVRSFCHRRILMSASFRSLATKTGRHCNRISVVLSSSFRSCGRTLDTDSEYLPLAVWPQRIMVRRPLEHHVTIVLDEEEDEAAIPDSFRRFIMQSLANGNYKPVAGEPHFGKHCSLNECVTGKGTVNQHLGLGKVENPTS
jgi:hypothetical protein